VIARRKGDHAPLLFLVRQLQQPVGRAPQLEGTAGLKGFALQPDLRRSDLGFNERSALDQAGDALRCGGDILGCYRSWIC
jgi:hypothetical protein